MYKSIIELCFGLGNQQKYNLSRVYYLKNQLTLRVVSTRLPLVRVRLRDIRKSFRVKHACRCN